jgi:transposase-like protein
LKLVQRCQRSPLSVRDFCQQHEVSESNFYAWRRVLRERGLIDEQAQLVETGTPAFIKLTLPAAPAPASAVEVVLGERVLRVRPGFDAAMLLELVRLLEEPA